MPARDKLPVGGGSGVGGGPSRRGPPPRNAANAARAARGAAPLAAALLAALLLALALRGAARRASRPGAAPLPSSWMGAGGAPGGQKKDTLVVYVYSPRVDPEEAQANFRYFLLAGVIDAGDWRCDHAVLVPEADKVRP